METANSIIRVLSLCRSPPVLTFLLQNWFLVLAAVVSGALLLWPMITRGAAGGITTAEAVRLINREKGVLIDVSEPAEYGAGHAAGARNIPFGSLESARNLPTNKALPLILICPSGARAGRAVGLLKKAGYENVQSVAGGLNAWREANLPLEKG
jgi:rhodanese-related sulfurtransferase